MFRLDEVRNEEQNRAERAPEKDVLHHCEGCQWQAVEYIAHRAGKRLPRVAALFGKVKALARESRSDVKENEQADDQRVAPDAHQCFGVEREGHFRNKKIETAA